MNDKKGYVLQRGDEVGIFGNGAVFKQVSPILQRAGIIPGSIFDDDIQRGQRLLPYGQGTGKNPKILYCVGYQDMKKRQEKFEEILSLGYEPVSLIPDNAIFSETARAARGFIAYQGCIVDNYAVLGDNVLLNIGANIGHEARLENNIFVSIGAVVCGHSHIESHCFIGAGATIIDGIRIGRGSVIGAGAVVIRDVEPFGVVVGNPARIIGKAEGW